MVRSVIVVRVHDGLRLAASMDDDKLDREFPDYRPKTQSVIRSLALQTEPMCTVEAGQFFFHCLIDHGVGFVCIADKIYPKRLAYSFLDDIAKQFSQQYTRDQIERANKAYAFIKFDTYIQKARRSYQDVRAQQNLDRLKEELVDVQHVMQTSIQDVLDRGNKLEHMSLLSSNLSSESKKFVQNARQLNIDMLYRKYGAPSIAILIVLFFLWVWYRWLR